MSLHKRIAVACALASAVLLGATSLTSAAPGQKGKKPAAKPAASGAAGQKVFMAQNCSACHKVAGKGGATGPDLSHIGKTLKAAAAKKYIRNPKSVNKNAKMPAYGADKLNDKDLGALVAYLGSLK